jgi:hypothetical protein
MGDGGPMLSDEMLTQLSEASLSDDDGQIIDHDEPRPAAE